MTVQDFGICLTAIISAISLLISIFNYWTKKPKLKIDISDKNWDCFYGRVIHDDNYISESYIGGARINIINNSPVAITINKINLIVNKETLRLIDNRIEHWENIDFYFPDDNGEITTNGVGICYSENGLSLPLKISAYDTITAYVLFHNFPARHKKKCKGKIVLSTAIGKVKKKVRMIEYDKYYMEADYRDYLQYCRSLDEN